MNQCRYRIKDAKEIGWWNCQLETGHDGPHRPPPRAAGKIREFEGIWHLPGEKSTADPEPPAVPFFGHNQFVPAKTSEEGNITPPPTTIARRTP